MQTEQDREVLRHIRDEVQVGKRSMDAPTIRELIDHMPNWQISIKVVSQNGICLGGHKVGDEWLMRGRRDGWKIPPGICMFAYDVLSPCIQMMTFGGSYPWAFNADVWPAPCPDSRNPVVFELRRLPES